MKCTFTVRLCEMSAEATIYGCSVRCVSLRNLPSSCEFLVASLHSREFPQSARRLDASLTTNCTHICYNFIFLSFENVVYRGCGGYLSLYCSRPAVLF